MTKLPCFRSKILGVAFALASSAALAGIAAASEGNRIAYFKDGEIHISAVGALDGEPLTEGHWDFKPSWSLTDDKLVFFRRLVNDKVVSNWKTAICIINADGSGFHQITDGSHTDFNQTWTRDGSNTPIWNRRIPGAKHYQVMSSAIGAKPGEEIALTDGSYNAWAFTCLTDGRILVGASPPGQGRGYYLMTPDPDGAPEFERIACPLGKEGVLARVSFSADETKVCFEYQSGFEKSVSGRTLYIADFDATTRKMSGFHAFANEDGKPVWFAYPRWTQDQNSIIYHAGKELFLYTLADQATVKVSTDDDAGYRYPHGEATPK